MISLLVTFRGQDAPAFWSTHTVTIIEERIAIANNLLEELRARAIKELSSRAPWEDVMLTNYLLSTLWMIIEDRTASLPPSIEEIEIAFLSAQERING
jgi:hypothetical protein